MTVCGFKQNNVGEENKVSLLFKMLRLFNFLMKLALFTWIRAGRLVVIATKWTVDNQAF